jgi:hypothetical protein
MNILPRLLIAALVVCLIAVAPSAVAQVDTAPPPTEEQLRMERELMQQRADRFERGLVLAETRVERIRDAEVRADVQARLRDIRERQAAWQQDWTAFRTVPPAEFHQRRTTIDQRLTDLEVAALEARLAAAVTPAEFRQVAQEYRTLHRDMIRDHSARLRELPRDRRAEAAWALIQLRSDYDELDRQLMRMERVPPARFAELRPQFVVRLPQFHARLARTDYEWRLHQDGIAVRR